RVRLVRSSGKFASLLQPRPVLKCRSRLFLLPSRSASPSRPEASPSDSAEPRDAPHCRLAEEAEEPAGCLPSAQPQAHARERPPELPKLAATAHRPPRPAPSSRGTPHSRSASAPAESTRHVCPGEY